jgi:hypothetical protein
MEKFDYSLYLLNVHRQLLLRIEAFIIASFDFNAPMRITHNELSNVLVIQSIPIEHNLRKLNIYILRREIWLRSKKEVEGFD